MVVVHTFSPSTREENKMGGDSSHLYRSYLRFLEVECLFWTEVEVRASGYLFCFSDLQVEHQYLSLGFDQTCYNNVLLR